MKNFEANTFLAQQVDTRTVPISRRINTHHVVNANAECALAARVEYLFRSLSSSKSEYKPPPA